MTCEELAGALHDYVGGDLVVAVQVALEAHAEVCEECGALLRTYRFTVRVAAALPRCRMSAAAEARLRAALADELKDE